MTVPTWEQLIENLRILEVDTKLDSLGRKVTKKNVNYGKASMIIYKKVSIADVKRVRDRLYNR